MVDSVSWELLRPGSSENEVPGDTGVDDLHNDLPVGKSDNKAVFRCVAVGNSCQHLFLGIPSNPLFVLRLGNQAFAGVV